ncbi:MAG: helix-turn-helix domain-containing protein [Dysgonamonadaceae bacterium]|jgi:transcriptional regulator with XRE-family HTH domain|nr:helix-turn-helix domain-containing protein [Dysgonamonadaceae bacterium]
MNINERVRKVFFEFANGNRKQFAEKVKMSEGYISSVLNGKKIPGKNFLKGILTAYPKVSKKWLYDGDGQMISRMIDPEWREVIKRFFKVMKELSIPAKKLARQINGLSEYSQKRLQDGFGTLTETQIEQFVKLYPKVNKEWLLCGTGDPIFISGMTTNREIITNVIEAAGVKSAYRLAELLNVQHQLLYQICSGSVPMSMRTANIIHEKYPQFKLHYLMSGNENMQYAKDQDKSAEEKRENKYDEMFSRINMLTAEVGELKVEISELKEAYRKTNELLTRLIADKMENSENKQTPHPKNTVKHYETNGKIPESLPLY